MNLNPESLTSVIQREFINYKGEVDKNYCQNAKIKDHNKNLIEKQNYNIFD